MKLKYLWLWENWYMHKRMFIVLDLNIDINTHKLSSIDSSGIKVVGYSLLKWFLIDWARATQLHCWPSQDINIIINIDIQYYNQHHLKVNFIMLQRRNIYIINLWCFLYQYKTIYQWVSHTLIPEKANKLYKDKLLLHNIP